MLRKVMVSRRVRNNNTWNIEEVGEAFFHQWLNEADSGDMSVVAVVEFPDGKVDTVYPYNVRFIDQSPNKCHVCGGPMPLEEGPCRTDLNKLLK